ncbi:hypothetical protein HX005_18840 [Acinetobacter sp. R933-2]|uniref:hypothetical protein n=1 Tax=Acinetobacter sp. R933-2 TaxID=2746728 RepID=UPI002575235F|nr:hypothetical protein [Acinetobacter sp. R933-2]MDM1249420.1 hypothetical protein [Acinetobacter sp. R933-2]
MKIQFKSVVLTAALLLGSSLTQAATTTSSIPMGIEIPKSCTFTNVSAGIILPEDGSEGLGKFTLTCNMDGGFTTSFRFESLSNSSTGQVVNADGIGLETSGVVDAGVHRNLPINGQPMVTYITGYLNRSIDHIVKVKLKSPITATTPSGVYTDTFYADVTY